MSKIYIVLLGLAALMISTVAAVFSVSGLAKLFAGAPVAVMCMAGALEFAKIVTAGFLHRAWSDMNTIMRLYLTTAVVVLVGITSMGIFGYLSQAYQVTSQNLNIVELKIESLTQTNRNITEERDRLEQVKNSIPENRVTRRIELQKEMEPRFQALRKQTLDNETALRELNLEKLSYQTKIGPILYVAKLFGKGTEDVVGYLIFLFVLVFDPLAISLVFATSFAIHLRNNPNAKKKKVVSPIMPTMNLSDSVFQHDNVA
jgi:hypothetical protein